MSVCPVPFSSPPAWMQLTRGKNVEFRHMKSSDETTAQPKFEKPGMLSKMYIKTKSNDLLNPLFSQ